MERTSQHTQKIYHGSWMMMKFHICCLYIIVVRCGRSSTNRPTNNRPMNIVVTMCYDIAMRRWVSISVLFVSFSGIVFLSNVQPCVRLIFILCLFVHIRKNIKRSKLVKNSLKRIYQMRNSGEKKKQKKVIFILFLCFFVDFCNFLFVSSSCHDTWRSEICVKVQT